MEAARILGEVRGLRGGRVPERGDRNVPYYMFRSEPNLIYVTVQPNESIDSALKRFNQKLQQSGVLRELKEHAHYEKPSEKRRRQRRRRISRQ